MKTMYQKLLLLLLMMPLGMLAQGTVSGVVSDSASGQPIPGVNVIVEGTGNGTSTDMDGNYTLSNVNTGDRIVFTFIGYSNQTVEYTGQTSLNISMQEDATQLQEVVVIGYGTVTRREATGSLTSVTSEDFNRGAVVTAENLLNGRVPGVTINTTGQPGASSVIRIRGGASLNASNDPLIVIDGLPITNSLPGGSTSVLASINPNDIESFTILKDASATAIYGSRASNGVIIITTKKGGKKFSVDYNFQYGSGKIASKVDVLSADQFREEITARFPDKVGLLGDANTDWQDEIYRRTDLVDNNLTVRGSLFGKVPARLSLGHTYQEGLRLTNTFNRSTASVALNPSFLNDHLKINVNANYSHERNRFAGAQEGAAIRFDPTQPVYDPASPFDGFFEYYNDGGLLQNVARNPVAALLQRRDVSKGNRVYGNVEFDYKFHFLPELRAVVNLGLDESKFDGTNSVPTTAASGLLNGNTPLGSYSEYSAFRHNRLLDAYLVYKTSFGKFDFDITGGYSYQKFDAYDYTTRDQRDIANLEPETTIKPDITLMAYFGRANFDYDNKYLLTLTYRRDGSSRFSEKFGDFPAVAFAWRLDEEFFPESQSISDLKLRLGYGVTGQQDISDAGYLFLQRYNLSSSISQYTLGNTPVVFGVPNFYNPEIRWEETTQYNAGIDYGFMNNRITGSVDVFYKESKDLLTFANVADGSNFGNAGFQNIGSFTTKGIEFAINADVVKNDNLTWNVNFNATHFQREIKELAYNADQFVGGVTGGTGTTIGIFREGYNPTSFYVYKQLYNEDGTPIEGAYGDLDGNGIINGDDRYIFRNADPKVTFGFASNLLYKGFDLYFNLRASIGNRLYNNTNSNLAQWGRLEDQAVLGNVPVSVMDTNFETEGTTELLLSDYYIEDASFLRMDNITLGYTFSNWLDGKASVRLYTGMQNVFVITEYSGLDPETWNTGINNQGVDNVIYPRPRTFLVGANVKF